MALSLDEKRAILNYRIQKAEKALVEAKDNSTLGHWNLVANRLYFAENPLSINMADAM